MLPTDVVVGTNLKGNGRFLRVQIMGRSAPTTSVFLLTFSRPRKNSLPND